MRIRAFLIVACCALALTGCGGNGTRSGTTPVSVRLDRNGSTVNLSAMHVIVSPNGGSPTDPAAASDVQPQSWANSINGTTFRELDFTIDSGQVPYFVYVQNTSGAADQATVTIFLNNRVGFRQTVMLGAGSTTK